MLARKCVDGDIGPCCGDAHGDGDIGPGCGDSSRRLFGETRADEFRSTWARVLGLKHPCYTLHIIMDCIPNATATASIYIRFTLYADPFPATTLKNCVSFDGGVTENHRTTHQQNVKQIKHVLKRIAQRKPRPPVKQCLEAGTRMGMGGFACGPAS